ncbi:hypothetical protein [Chamaesiphon minutus]|uniref:Uncharacterized protein n=1 Tax=Chamaesiphon minutus (strain ATCC 27169 / PCC 6605) TaxID=1173020 RepID=K9UF71_CHAP6|nr:hypothetical protein [Chamaesiphon minutus]AFY93278.1 hypothetical protein Cha6605_2195 [Chamaesiphon minutus PCC 6605]
MYRWIQGTVVLCCSIALCALPTRAQLLPISKINLTLTTPILSPVITLKSGEILRVKVERLPPQTEIAVFLGDLDITSQMQREGQELVYKSTFLPLPVGEQTLTVYRTTTPDRWEPVATFPVKITPNSSQIATQTEESGKSPTSTTTPAPSPDPSSQPDSIPANPSDSQSPTATTPPPAGAAPATTSATATDPTSPIGFSTKLNVNIKSQLAESRSPDAGVSPRPTFLDADFTGELSALYPIGTGKLQGKVNLVGTTFQPEALRFNELQERSPLVDLSAYSIDFTDGENKVAIGNVCFGNNPLLVSNVCTRGVTANLKLNNFADLSIGHLSTTAIVGFDNILGIGESNNNLTGATLGMQVANNNSGGVRLETTVMNGSRLPVANFNVGEVVDAETSDGIGFRVTAANDDGRWKADAGFARSTFTAGGNNDPQLTEGTNAIALQPVTKNAWYAETSYDILKDVKLDDKRNIALSANIKLEQTDPQFGTLGATVNADRLQAQYGINATIAGANIQFQHTNSEDNIANLPNLLKTRNNSDTISLNIPLQSVLQNNSPLLPTISYSYQKTAQNGSILAALNGGFDEPSEIPNQLTNTQEIGLEWKFSEALSFDYKFSTTFQDNRQPGRENADFNNTSHQFSVGWQPSQQLRFNLGYNFTNAQNIERQITRFTQSPTFGVSWEFVPDVTLALNYNFNNDSDSIGESLTRSNALDLLLTWNFKTNTFGRENPGSVFLRYSGQSNLNSSSIGNINTNSTINTISTGMSLSF